MNKTIKLLEQDLYTYPPSAIKTFTKYYNISANDKTVYRQIAERNAAKKASMPGITDLPEADWQILLSANYSDLKNLCATSKTMKSICDSEAFWEQKLQRDYGITSDSKTFYEMIRGIELDIQGGVDLNLSEKLQLALVKKNPSYYSLLDNPFQSVSDLAIELQPRNIIEMLEYTANQLIKAIDADPIILKRLNEMYKLTINESIKLIEQGGLEKHPALYQLLETRSPAVQMAMVTFNPKLIRRIPSASDQVQMYIAKNHLELLKNIKNTHSDKLQMYIVENHPELIGKLNKIGGPALLYIVQTKPELVKNIRPSQIKNDTIKYIYKQYLKNNPEKINEFTDNTALTIKILARKIELIEEIENPNRIVKNYVMDNNIEHYRAIYPNDKCAKYNLNKLRRMGRKNKISGETRSSLCERLGLYE